MSPRHLSLECQSPPDPSWIIGQRQRPPELFNLTFVSNLGMALVSAFAGVFQQIGSRLAHFGLIATKNHQPVVCSDTM